MFVLYKHIKDKEALARLKIPCTYKIEEAIEPNTSDITNKSTIAQRPISVLRVKQTSINISVTALSLKFIHISNDLLNIWYYWLQVSKFRLQILSEC